MHISIRYSGPLIPLTGRRWETVTLPEHATVIQALRHLSQIYGRPFRRLFFNDQLEFEPEFVLVWNGEIFEDYQRPLCDEDEIGLVALFAGGSSDRRNGEQPIAALMHPRWIGKAGH